MRIYNQMVINYYIVANTFRSKINLATRSYFNAWINININYSAEIYYLAYNYIINVGKQYYIHAQFQ